MTPEQILTHPLMGLFVTISSYLAAQKIQEKAGGHNLLNPVALSISFVVIYIVASGIAYEDYLNNVNLIHALLGPATIALALPLYRHLALIRQSACSIIGGVLGACLIAAGSAYCIALWINADEKLRLALIPKSATTPIAIGIAEKIHADPGLAIFFVFTTGIIGSMIAPPLFKLLRIKDEKAIGLSLGAACHGLGVARAIQIGEKAGAFAALGMSLMGIVSGILLPVLVKMILK